MAATVAGPHLLHHFRGDLAPSAFEEMVANAVVVAHGDIQIQVNGG